MFLWRCYDANGTRRRRKWAIHALLSFIWETATAVSNSIEHIAKAFSIYVFGSNIVNMVNLIKLTMRPVSILCHWCSRITVVRTRACLAATALLNQDDPLKRIWILWKLMFLKVQAVARQQPLWRSCKRTTAMAQIDAGEPLSTLSFRQNDIAVHKCELWDLTELQSFKASPHQQNKLSLHDCDRWSTIGGELLLYSN